ncbi:gastric intrinsic factor [Trichonephila clavata]|uniref:Gastric intrinsic factor n=1 Tax=Trichonephila clavata TaxID=2740835 RepID=A0A8X6GMK6_TRICU|nr:gastric intrinsic factor [Trichonephila clavata]
MAEGNVYPPEEEFSYICSTCKNETEEPESNFMSVVSSESCYTCTKCGDEFETGYQRGKTKAGDMPSYICNVCGEMFPKGYLLLYHSYEHTDTWPYRCSFCSKGFPKLSRWEIHLRQRNIALLIHDSFDKDFNLKSALQPILESVSGNVTLLNAYYALPVLNGKILLNVSSSHCSTTPETEIQMELRSVWSELGSSILRLISGSSGESLERQWRNPFCPVLWFGDKIELARTWRLKMHSNNSIYDVIETVAKIDNRQKVEYNVVEGKPFVTSFGGIEDDPERGTFWFVHLKNLSSDGELMEQSKGAVNLI